MSEADRRKWDERWRAARAHGAAEAPSELLERLGAGPGLLAAEGGAPLLPARGRGLDLAGGAGRHALWLARRGLHVTVADVSPVGLELARARAEAAGLARAVETLCVDFDADPVPGGPWDLVLSFHFLDRRVLAAVPDVLRPGGVLVVVHPTRTNLERHERPSARFLLDDGELARLVAPRLSLIHYEEGWLLEGRHEACAVARRPV